MKIAIINQKGGVGKTTTTVNLAGAFAEMGLQVLAVDVDSQGDLSSVFLDNHETLPHTIASLFDDAGVSARDIIRTGDDMRIDVMPADRRLNSVDLTRDYLRQANVTAIGDALAELGDRYQMVLMDCAPRSHLSSFSALAAADLILVPVEVESFAVRSLAAVEDDFHQSQLFNPGSRIRYFLSKVPASSKGQEKARQALSEALGPANLLRTAIPLLASFRSAINVRQPIMFAKAKSKASDIMREFAREVLELSHGHQAAA